MDMFPSNAMSISQISRMYAAMLPYIKEQDWIIVSDSDILPVATGHGDYFRTPKNSKPIYLTDLNVWQDTKFIHWEMKHLCATNIGMTAHYWRKIFKYSRIDSNDTSAIVLRINDDLMTLFG